MLGYNLKDNAKVVTSKALHHSTYTYLPSYSIRGEYPSQQSQLWGRYE